MENWRKKLKEFIFDRSNGIISRCGVEPEALPLMVLRSWKSGNGPLVLALPEVQTLERLLSELEAWSEALKLTPRILVVPECDRGKLLFPGGEVSRARALNALLIEDFDIICGSVHALLGPAQAPNETQEAQLTLSRNMVIAPDELLDRLVKLDYDDELEVNISGEFARRGGIIDIFSPAEDFPCRVEYFGDEIYSLRSFSPETQRSTGEISSYQIINRAGITAGGAADSDAFAYLELRPFRLLDIWPAAASERLSCFSVPGAVERFDLLREKLKKDNRLITFDDIPGSMDIPPADVLPLSLDSTGVLPEHASKAGYKINITELEEQIKRVHNCGGNTVIMANHKEGLEELISWCQRCLPGAKNVEFGVLPIIDGVEINIPHTLIISEKEVVATGFKRTPIENDETAEPEEIIPPVENAGADFSLTDFDEGDYIVHLDYGIGIFRGFKLVSNSVETHEVMVVEYRDHQLLYVPLLQAYKISRYLGSAAKIQLHVINGSKWKRDKDFALNGVRSYAADMLRFQAMRQAVKGISFRCQRSIWNGFLRSFPYHDTRDQKRTTQELLRDMSSEKPMDRLICGDVGYGKTEMAMRAAFQAVASGYQVAVIAPTTVLTQQHFCSFTERFAEYPVTIDVVSRFRTMAEQHKIAERLSSGGIDILIGTHRICNSDFKFKNLGLVIIDEEQRFGVEHKERLRRFRAEADVLTMSATPIPRTLYMAMAGARDLSTLMTPPKLRLPVKTVIAPHRDDLIVSAIRAELARGGQVYYLHNRVKTIEECAEKLRLLLPEAGIAVAHGQMAEHQLEERMSSFVEGKYDVLVCSTIIESGLDVPHANTIIIERADRFGLAELYQLRGRVGRWKVQAYAYMLLPERELIGTNARKRLAAIRRCSNLGAGFQLALRDLEIRGSGNLLGAEQSGHLNLIGFDLYCQLLKQEIAQLNGTKLEVAIESDVRLDFVSYAASDDPKKLPALFPREWISGDRMLVSAYRRLVKLQSEEELEDFKYELEDRFGDIPEIAINLLEVIRIKLLASKAGYTQLHVTAGRVSLSNTGSQIYRHNGMAPQLDYRDPPKLRLLQLQHLLRELAE